MGPAGHTESAARAADALSARGHARGTRTTALVLRFVVLALAAGLFGAALTLPVQGKESGKVISGCEFLWPGIVEYCPYWLFLDDELAERGWYSVAALLTPALWGGLAYLVGGWRFAIIACAFSGALIGLGLLLAAPPDLLLLPGYLCWIAGLGCLGVALVLPPMNELRAA